MKKIKINRLPKAMDERGRWLINLFQQEIRKADNRPISGSETEIWIGLDRDIGNALIGPIRKYLGMMLGKVEAEAFFEVILKEDGKKEDGSEYRIVLKRR